MKGWLKIGSVAAFIVLAALAIAIGPTAAVGPIGRDTIGLVDVDTGEWHLTSEDDLVTTFFFGNPGDLPVAGDWSGNGITTPGLYRQSDGFWYGRNSNTQGNADFSCFAGDPSDIPISGDFDNDGDDDLGLYRPSEQKFYLFTVSCTGAPMGAAQISFLFGDPGDLPYSGDFDGDGITEVGLFRPTTGFVYYRDTLTTGNATNSFFWGDPGDRVFSGDWTADGTDTPGLYRPDAVMSFFRNTNDAGNADSTFLFGRELWHPVSGKFGLVGGVPPTTSTSTTTTTTTTLPTANCPAPCTVDNVTLSGSNFFSPKNITINAGQSVTWNWGSSAHTVTSGTGSWPNGPGGEKFNSGIQMAGSTFSYTFTASDAGKTFAYFCQIHVGQTGTVKVLP